MANRVLERRRIRCGKIHEYATRDLLSARNTHSLLQTPVEVSWDGTKCARDPSGQCCRDIARSRCWLMVAKADTSPKVVVWMLYGTPKYMVIIPNIMPPSHAACVPYSCTTSTRIHLKIFNRINPYPVGGLSAPV